MHQKEFLQWKLNREHPHSAQAAIADTFTYAEAVIQAQAIPTTNTTLQPKPMDQAAASASTDQVAATQATHKRANGGKKRKTEHEALHPLNNINNTQYAS